MKHFVVKFKIEDTALVDAETIEDAKRIFLANIKFSSGTIQIEEIYEYDHLKANEK